MFQQIEASVNLLIFKLKLVERKLTRTITRGTRDSHEHHIHRHKCIPIVFSTGHSISK